MQDQENGCMSAVLVGENMRKKADGVVTIRFFTCTHQFLWSSGRKSEENMNHMKSDPVINPGGLTSIFSH